MIVRLPWHQTLLQGLGERKANGGLPHALLIRVNSDSEAEACGQALAQILLCERGEGCGSCPSCLRFAEGVHSDYLRLSPEQNSREIKVGQVRELLAFGHQTARHAFGKCILITPADRLNRNAANALLKFLEEPPAESYLILTTGRAGALPATVQSRCQVSTVAKPSLNVALEFLRDRGLSESNLTEYLRLASGDPLRVLAWESEGVLDELHQISKEFGDLITGGPSGSADVHKRFERVPSTQLLDVLAVTLHEHARRSAENNQVKDSVLKAHSELVELQRKHRASPNINIPLALEELCVNI